MNYKLLFLFLPLLFLFTCGKEKIELTWQKQSSNVDNTLTRVHFVDEMHGYIAGGSTWYEGVILHTEDGGKKWNVDTLFPKQLNGLDFTASGRGFAAGIDGHIYRRDTMLDYWEKWHYPRYEILTSINYFDETHGIATAGIAYQAGAIVTMGENFDILAIDTFEQELVDVFYSEKDIVHAVGYGLVLRSTDGGMHWDVDDVKGDFFRSVYFSSPETGYIVAYSGTILKTRDKGKTWKKIRNGSKPQTSNVPFRSVFFVNDNRGYIVGDGGTFWRTTNDGDDWEVVKGLPDVDLYDVFVIGGKGYIVGEKGAIFQFEEE